MKRYKRLIGLLMVLLVACGATFGIMSYQEKQEQIKNSDEIILEIAPDTVQSLSWEYESETLSFHRDDTWKYDEDEAFPVDEDKMEEMLDTFASFGVSFIIEQVEDYGQYGLDDPICTISLATEDESYEITLGDFSTMDEKRYVSIGDGNVYLVSDDPLEVFDAVLSDVIDHDEVPDFDTVTGIQFAGEQAYHIVYQEDSTNTYCADDVYFVEDGNLPLDTSLVDGYLGEITGLSLTNYVNYKVAEEDLATYGLDNPQLTISVDYSQENEEGETVSNTFTLSVGRSEDQLSQAQEEDTESQDVPAYVRVGDSSIIYEITGQEYEALMAASYDDLRHKEAFTGEFTQVYQVDVNLDGQAYTLTSTQEDEEQTWYYGEEEVDITDLESAVSGLNASSFTQETPEQQEEISITLYLDDGNFPTVELAFYRYDGTYCLAVVDGEPTSLVERDAVVDLVEAVNAIVLN